MYQVCYHITLEAETTIIILIGLGLSIVLKLKIKHIQITWNLESWENK